MTAFAPMLAALGRESDVDERDGDWAFEMKWDGIRAIATVEQGKARFATRNGIDVTVSYPELAELATQVSGDAMFDGEIVALNKSGRPDFGLLQRRMKLTRPTDVNPAVRDVPVHYMVFDIVRVNGRDVTSLDYAQRRVLLDETLRPRGRIQLPPAFDVDLDSAIAASLALGLEGVVAKRRDSTYSVGRRSAAWIKIKHRRTQEVVVGGWRPGHGRRFSTVGSLLLGVRRGGGLRYVGRVGTGFGDRDLEELTERLSTMARATTSFVDVPKADARDAHWVTPTLVGEVEFAEWTPSGRLRQASWRGLRPDKVARDVVREDPPR